MVPVSFASFPFHGEEWQLTPSNALYWPRENALLVADLHLEKASFFATTGQLLPPYDSRETLERIALALRATGARRVFCLGDNFHDARGAERLEPHAAGMLDALTRATDWVWITGNHDHSHLARGQQRVAAVGGTELDEAEIGGVVLRHHARRGEERPELSGHFHPRLQVKVNGRRIVRPCVVTSDSRMILPAFGSMTAGMSAADPAILKALQPASAIDARVAASGKVLRFPLWRAA